MKKTLGAGAALLLMTACGAGLEEKPSDPTGSVSQADTVTPTGQENLGYLKLVLPSEETTDFTVKVNNLIVPKDGTGLRLLKGKYCVTVHSQHFKVGTSECEVEVKAKSTTLYKPALIRIKYDQGGKADALQPIRFFQPKVTLRNPTDGITIASEYQYGVGEEHALSGVATKWSVVAAGEYEVGLGEWWHEFQRLAIEKVAGGTSTEIDLTPESEMAYVRVVPPAKREFPTSGYDGECGARVDNLPNTATEPNFVSAAVLGEGTKLVRVFAATSARPEGGAVEVHASGSVPSKAVLKPGQVHEVRLRRIDVDDVTVTREDGTTYTTMGGVYITTEKSDGTWTALNGACGNFFTKHGVDVIPGRYKVHVSYQTQEGPQSFEQELNLR